MFTASRIESESREVNPLSGKRVDVDARTLRAPQPLCSECQRRPALARLRGRYVVLEDHDLCRQCWRARWDARAATRLARRGRSR
jgi:hypothetical protein